MRILPTISIVLLALALSLPAVACDRHGGMFGQLNGAAWTDYNPSRAESDASFLEEQLSKWHEQNEVPAVEVKPAKPTFSKVTSRASLAAQVRVAKKAKSSEEADLKSDITLAKATKASDTASR